MPSADDLAAQLQAIRDRLDADEFEELATGQGGVWNDLQRATVRLAITLAEGHLDAGELTALEALRIQRLIDENRPKETVSERPTGA